MDITLIRREEDILDVLGKFHRADLKLMGERSVKIESDFTPDKAAKRIFDACQKVFGKC